MNSKNIAVTIIIALAVGVGGFYGGTVYEKSSLNKQGLLRNPDNAQFGNRGGQNEQGGQGGSGRQGGMGFNRNGGGGFTAG